MILAIVAYFLVGLICAVGHELSYYRTDGVDRFFWFTLWPIGLVIWGVDSLITGCVDLVETFLLWWGTGA